MKSLGKAAQCQEKRAITRRLAATTNWNELLFHQGLDRETAADSSAAGTTYLL
jgi:hypothetical protein